MKKFFFAIAIVGLIPVASASVLGFLVQQRFSESVGGQIGYECIYRVPTLQGVQYVAVFEPRVCVPYYAFNVRFYE